MQDGGLEEEVCGDQDPGEGEGEQAEEGDAGFLAAGAAGFGYVFAAVGVCVDLADGPYIWEGEVERVFVYLEMVLKTSTMPPYTMYHSFHARLYIESGMML